MEAWQIRIAVGLSFPWAITCSTHRWTLLFFGMAGPPIPEPDAAPQSGIAISAPTPYQEPVTTKHRFACPARKAPIRRALGITVPCRWFYQLRIYDPKDAPDKAPSYATAWVFTTRECVHCGRRQLQTNRSGFRDLDACFQRPSQQWLKECFLQAKTVGSGWHLPIRLDR